MNGGSIYALHTMLTIHVNISVAVISVRTQNSDQKLGCNFRTNTKFRPKIGGWQLLLVRQLYGNIDLAIEIGRSVWPDKIARGAAVRTRISWVAVVWWSSFKL
jgi:hypothetical protein